MVRLIDTVSLDPTICDSFPRHTESVGFAASAIFLLMIKFPFPASMGESMS